MKNILLIGGTGIIGKATVLEALKEGYEVTTISKEIESNFPNSVKQLLIDRQNMNEFQDIVSKLNNQWDVVFDIFAYDEKDAKQTYDLFKDKAKHIFILSTTLVYDRSKKNTNPIKSNHPLTKKGELGGYVDKKLGLEQFWLSKKDANWTIIRPYHILGATSLLGCLPLHNRDPELLKRIKNNEKIVLCNGGEVELNYLHPRDLAKTVLKSAGNKKTFWKAYNVVNPTKIKVKDYFEIIGEMLGEKIQIINKPISEIWDENKGWELTTLPHIYDVTDLKRDIGFVPDIPLREAIKEAIENYPEMTVEKDKIPVHQRMNVLPKPEPITWLLSDK
jgi:nucleoside-diphosphate-sugar epimerase